MNTSKFRGIDLNISAFTSLRFGKENNFGFAFSKIWLSINPIPEESGNLWEYPMQKYFMNLGPWISNKAYAIHGILVLVLFIILLFRYYRIKKSNKPILEV